MTRPSLQVCTKGRGQAFSKVNSNEELQVSASLKPTCSPFPKGHQSLDELAKGPKSLLHSPPWATCWLCHKRYSAQVPRGLSVFLSPIWHTYCHQQFLHTVRGHTVQMGQMKLEMHFVAEDILAEGAADNRLH